MITTQKLLYSDILLHMSDVKALIFNDFSMILLNLAVSSLASKHTIHGHFFSILYIFLKEREILRLLNKNQEMLVKLFLMKVFSFEFLIAFVKYK